jgi:predicted ATPase
MRPQLTHVRVTGYRSLRDARLDLGPVTVLIGPNGAGKSNLLDALFMVRRIAQGRLQHFVSQRGGASYLLHYGPKQTPSLDIRLELSSDEARYAYEARLEYGADESLWFAEERVESRGRPDDPWQSHAMGSGHRESRLAHEAERHALPQTVLGLLLQLKFYHFHDTSTTSPLRTLARAEDDLDVWSDGGNLAAYLLALRDSREEGDQAAWRRIQGLVHRVAPFVREIRPELPFDKRGVRLSWIDDRGEKFGPAHLSDGTLRAIALLTALGQPAERLPILSSIDEPELGLHPSAIHVLCALIKSVAVNRQVLLATQSPALLDEFAPEDVVVTERVDGATELRRLDPKALESWLEDYSLSELYDKNVLGGRP